MPFCLFSYESQRNDAHFRILSLVLLASVTVYVQVTSPGDPSPGKSFAKETSVASEQTQTPRAFIESRLGGKVLKVEKDPSDLRRAVLQSTEAGP